MILFTMMIFHLITRSLGLGTCVKWLHSLLVEEEDGGSLECRQIFDVVLIANEAIDSMLKSNKSGGLYRLDIEKRMTMLIETFYLSWKVEDLEELALEVSCKWGVLSTTYLGLPLGASHNSLCVEGWKKFKGTFFGMWTLESKPHLVKWATACSDKRKQELGAFIHLIRSSFVSGIDVMLQKGRRFRDKLFAGRYGKQKEVGALRKQEAAMALGYGRP
ncbi:hypothetical protein CK203_019797 [Vitis vinifera]|uniref:Uncharacterized protein n=1 Tax=Vitis vinifera TaxID=29760 RepID=A0A438JQP0_VITVI|nr:hypothetical protein CK203_019797 [Vitis vinifera]